MVFTFSTAIVEVVSASCPANWLELHDLGSLQLHTTMPRDSLAIDDSLIRYDLRLGFFQTSLNGGDVSGYSTLRAVDEFIIEGPPPGSVVSLTAELHVRASALGGCGMSYHVPNGIVTVQLASASSTQSVTVQTTSAGCPYPDEFYCCTNSGSTNTVLLIPLSVAAADSFPLECVMTGSSSFSPIYAEAELRFVGLPPGTRVTSCQGFSQDAPTSARPASWGSLKIRYR